MNYTFIKRACVLGMLVIGCTAVIIKMRSLDVGSQFAITILGGCVVAIVIAKIVVPRLGDAVGTFFYSSSAVATPEQGTQASARLAQGDYEGAILEYESILRGQPDDTLAINEIASIRAHKLGDVRGALDFLQQQLEARDWPEDSAAFLMFRIVDLQLEMLHDYAGAQSVLEQVVTTFPNTRHSANAHHKIHEIQQAQFKAAAAERLKHSSHS